MARILVDTSVLTRLVPIAGDVARGDAIGTALESEGELVVAAQCLFEFYAVATRPGESRGGLGLTGEEARRALRGFRETFVLLPDPPDLFDLWLGVVAEFGVVGREARDARLAAFARGHGIPRVATRDRGGFARFGLGEVVPEA